MKGEKVSVPKRHSIRFLTEHHSSKAPKLITENDQLSPNLPVDDLVQRRIHILEGIAKGDADINAGRCFTDIEAREKLKIWLE